MNLGDEQYKISFAYLFSKLSIKHTLIFIDADKLNEFTIKQKDIIILGGGDIINEYFLSNIHNILSNKQNMVIALSVGIPYKQYLIKFNNFIDYIFIRTKQDLKYLSYYYDSDRLFYIPDISINLNKSLIYTHNDMITKISENKKIITITLSRHIYDENTNNYTELLNNFKYIIMYLISEKYFIILIPFNSNDNNFENDNIIHNDIMNLIGENNNILNFNNCSNETVYKIYKYYTHYNITMRFHSCLYSFYNIKPFFPIYTTRKIHNLLTDLDWNNFSYKIPTDTNDIPTSINTTVLLDTLCKMLKYDYIELQSKLLKSYNEYLSDYKKSITYVKNIFSKPSKNKNLNKMDTFLDSIYINYLLPNINTLDKTTTSKNILKILTQSDNINNDYIYGLNEKMYIPGYNYKDEWKWIISKVI